MLYTLMKDSSMLGLIHDADILLTESAEVGFIATNTLMSGIAFENVIISWRLFILMVLSTEATSEHTLLTGLQVVRHL